MKRLISIIVFLVTIQLIQAQNIGAFGGVNTMTNYPFQSSDEHYYTNFSPIIGYSIGLELDDIYLLKIPIKITTRINKYNGIIAYESSGMGGGYNVDITQENYCLALGLHFLMNKRTSPFQFSLGAEYSLLLKEKFTGTITKWEMNKGVETENIDENSFALNTINRIAIIGTIGYKKEITEGW